MQTVTLIDTDLVARLERQWRIAVREEERAIARSATESAIYRCARASDRARRVLDLALRGQPIPAPRVPQTQRNRGKAGLGALALVGRTIARAVARQAALVKARAAAVLWRAAKAARSAFRRALRAVVAFITPTKELPVSKTARPARVVTVDHQIVIGNDGVVTVTDRHGTQHQLVRVGGANGLVLRARLIGESFVLEGGLQGDHSLDADRINTSADRLLAHWQGYCANNGSPGWEVVKLERVEDRQYPYHLTVVNHYDGGRRVEWNVPDLDSESYDLSPLTAAELALIDGEVAL